jgi:hypothetical protein
MLHRCKFIHYLFRAVGQMIDHKISVSVLIDAKEKVLQNISWEVFATVTSFQLVTESIHNNKICNQKEYQYQYVCPYACVCERVNKLTIF